MGTPSGYLRRRPGHQPSWIAGFGVGWPWLLDCSRHRRGFAAEEKVSWLETYRGFVYRWEVDHNDHLTVAYYLARVADAGLGLLEALGLGPAYMKRSGRGCVTSASCASATSCTSRAASSAPSATRSSSVTRCSTPRTARSAPRSSSPCATST